MLEHTRMVSALLACALLAAAQPARAAETSPLATATATATATGPGTAAGCETARIASSVAAAAAAAAARSGPRITDASPRTAVGAPATCEVTARIASGARLQIALPASDWNGALAELRCEAGCGAPLARACDAITARGYACFAGDPASVEAAHEVLVAARAIVAAHYGKPAKAAVLLSCASGAGTGLQQAAAHPADYQGIVAGAPILDAARQAHRQRWLAGTLQAPGGAPRLVAGDLARLHAQALAACDGGDGLADGVIGDPLRCRVPTAALRCAPGQHGDCLDGEQVEAIDRLYAGPPEDPSAGALPGSELGWLQARSAPRPRASIARNATAARVATGTTPAHADVPPDLRAFAAAGGKLLLFQGLADTQVPPRQTALLYERWTATLGGPVKATAVVRLFMVPGMQHCGGGDGPWQVDFLRGIENWTVTARRAPDDLIAFHPRDAAAAGGNMFAPRAVDPAQKVFASWQVGVDVTLVEARDQPHASFSRPLYLYPVHTQYKGMGDPNFWRSFYGPNDYPHLLP